MNPKFKKGIKQAYVFAYVTAALLLTNGTSAFATGVNAPGQSNLPDPTGLSSLNPDSTNGSKSSSGLALLGKDVGTIAKWVIGVIGGVAVAWTLYEIYHLVFLIFQGGTNAKKREEAKLHGLFLLIGAGLTGASGWVLGVLLGLFKDLSTTSATGNVVLSMLLALHVH